MGQNFVGKISNYLWKINASRGIDHNGGIRATGGVLGEAARVDNKAVVDVLSVNSKYAHWIRQFVHARRIQLTMKSVHRKVGSLWTLTK